MKKTLLSILLLLAFGNMSYASIEVKPSISDQMRLEQKLAKKNIFAEKRALLKNKSIYKTGAIVPSKNSTTKISLSSTGASIPPKVSAVATGKPIYTNSSVPGVDMDSVSKVWLGWYNKERSLLGLPEYVHDPRLDSTAHDWNIVFAQGKGTNHHRRNPGDSYYDFSQIDAWFMARGINPKVVNRSKHTENVGFGSYSCDASDCTEKLISSIRSTFDFYMSEKGKSYDAHYRSIVHPDLKKMGLDIIVVPSERRYYMTVHFTTE